MSKRYSAANSTCNNKPAMQFTATQRAEGVCDMSRNYQHRTVTCGRCDGTGKAMLGGGMAASCGACEGQGKIEMRVESPPYNTRSTSALESDPLFGSIGIVILSLCVGTSLAIAFNPAVGIAGSLSFAIYAFWVALKPFD